MLSVSLIAIVPLQLGLECVVLLGEVLLSVVVGVAPPVAPLKGVWGGHIDVLEVVVPGVGSVSPGLGEGDAPGSSGAWGLGKAATEATRQATDTLSLENTANLPNLPAY